ncbi:MAG: hypothetical protein M4D80_17685 [Myxococcota bacterium]|nr:hypothetical protein [Myxococcota bacterium]
MFVWSPELDALAPPRRGQGPSISATHQMGRVRMFRSALKARAIGYEPRASLVRLMRTGTGDLADEADAFLLACSAPRRGTGVGKISGLSEVEAAKVAISGVDRWVQLRGIVRAVEIFTLLGAWRPVPLFSGEHARVLAAIRLRQWLAHTTDYDAALAWVRRSEGLPHGMLGWRTSRGYDGGHEAIAYLFPDHRPFFARAAEELRTHDARTTLLLGAIGSTEDHDQIADRIGDADLDRNALVIARELREHGLPRLIDHARVSRLVPRGAQTAPGIVLALGAYSSLDAVRALALFAKPGSDSGSDSGDPRHRPNRLSRPTS